MIENTEELLGQIVPSGSVVGAMLTEKGDKGDKGDNGETGNDGFSPIITTSKQGKVTTLTIVDAEGTKTATINDGADGSGSGDMLKSTYDANENGIVDNAEKVNNHTVLSDVPANAVFTDTTYTAGTGIDITNGVISNTQTSAEWGNISGDITDQSDLQSALSDKANTSDLAAVATSGSYNDLTNKPTIPTVNNATLTIQKNSTTLDTFTANASVDKTVNISVPTKVSDLSNDSGFITNSVNNLTNYTTTSTLNTLLAGKEKDIPIQDTAPQNPEENDLWIDTSEPEEMQEAIVNEYSESTTDTYSCDYINDKLGGLLDIFYPVGSYYETSNTSFNPNTAWGGTWVEDSKGRFLLSTGIPEANTDNYFGNMSGTQYSCGVGSRGGQDFASNPLSDNGYAKIQLRSTGAIEYRELNISAWNTTYKVQASSGSSASDNGNYGAALGGKTDIGNNMPPYVGVKRWHRTA